jgi:hypothetical protein
MQHTRQPWQLNAYLSMLFTRNSTSVLPARVAGTANAAKELNTAGQQQLQAHCL